MKDAVLCDAVWYAYTLEAVDADIDQTAVAPNVNGQRAVLEKGGELNL